MPTDMLTNRTIHLTPPLLDAAQIKEKVVCIRAHRERIFNVSVEKQNNTLICHNYGHGGAGWTFLFGCVNESIRQLQAELEQFPQFKNKRIAVIGAGCHGLLTAITLAHMGFAVKIIAREVDNIPSYKAAGFFFPRPRKVSDERERAIFQAFGIESYQTYLSIADGTHPFIKAGARLVPAYYGPEINPGFAPYIEQGLIEKPESVLIQFGSGSIYDAMEYTVAHINAAVIMGELKKEVARLCIPIEQAEVPNFCAIDEQIIMNCAGLGAKKLANDRRVIPIQGHLITLQNQPTQLNYMINMRVFQNTPNGRPRDELIYFAPKDEGILGITFIRGQDSLTANEHEFDRLLERCKKFFGT